MLSVHNERITLRAWVFCRTLVGFSWVSPCSQKNSPVGPGKDVQTEIFSHPQLKTDMELDPEMTSLKKSKRG